MRILRSAVLHTAYGSGQEGEDVRGVAVKAFGKLQHGVEVGGEDGHVPAGDDAVLEVVAGDVLVGGEVGRAGDVVRFEYAEHGHYLHDAADVDLARRATLLAISLPLARWERMKVL